MCTGGAARQIVLLLYLDAVDIFGVVILVRDAAAQLLGPADRSDGLEWRAVEVGTGALRYP